ncbi:hypothetical protein [Marinomonas sp. PE14-40]|uniref:hypothetical protein n=1 Tax=Marinomonas sp. PE14-40 TaxID=3060621 RepID=UPI003F6786AD
MLTKRVLFSGLLLFVSSFLNSISAQTIIGIDIPGLHNNDGQGIYDVMIRDATGRDVLIMPPARAVNAYDSCTDCCISPANKNPDFYEYGDGHIVSSPMFTAQIFIFSKPGDAAINDVALLKGKKVGARKGMPYGNHVESSGARFMKVDQLTKNIKKLERGSLDYMVAYTPDIYDAFYSAGKDPFPHTKTSPVASHEDSLLCKDTPENQALIKKLNDAI